MKKLFSLLPLCLLINVSLAQFLVDTSVAKNYNKIAGQFSEGFQQDLTEIPTNSKLPGRAIFIVSDIDTLNKNEYMGSKIIADVPLTGKLVDSNGTEISLAGKRAYFLSNEKTNYTTVLFEGILKEDTLLLEMPTVFLKAIVHKINNGKIISIYNEKSEKGKIFKLSLSQKRSEQLTVSAKIIGFKLSTDSFKPGENLYGEVEYITEPYYEEDLNFSTKFIHKRLHCKYVFKVAIIDYKDSFYAKYHY